MWAVWNPDGWKSQGFCSTGDQKEMRRKKNGNGLFALIIDKPWAQPKRFEPKISRFRVQRYVYRNEAKSTPSTQIWIAHHHWSFYFFSSTRKLTCFHPRYGSVYSCWPFSSWRRSPELGIFVSTFTIDFFTFRHETWWNFTHDVVYSFLAFSVLTEPAKSLAPNVV